MKFRQALLVTAAGLLGVAAGAAKPTIEIASQAAPHGSTPRQWLQRLAEAGAGTARLVGSRGGERPRIEQLGETAAGDPIVKIYAVLKRGDELFLPGAGGPERFRLSDRTKLADYFERLEANGAERQTQSTGKHGLAEAEFTDLFTRLQTPLGEVEPAVSLRGVLDAASRRARVTIEPDASIVSVLGSPAEGIDGLSYLATGTALAAVLRDQGLAIEPTKPPGRPVVLRVVEARSAKDAWPVGYDPEASPSRTAPALMEFLTVEIEGYTLAEALNAIAPRLTWNDRPIPIVWDRFAMRSEGIDPASHPGPLPVGPHLLQEAAR